MPEDRGPSIRESPDTAYRRGTVLGLTVAEVFILLLFLLMLAFLALTQEWAAVIATPQTPIEEELVKAKSTLQEVRKIVEEHKKSIPVPEEPVTLVEEENDEPQDPEDSTDDPEDNLAEDVGELLESASDAIQKEKMKAQEAEKRADAAEAARDEARQAATQAGRDLDVLRTKGHNPPCWYERVPTGRSGVREKPYYTFEVAVFDENMILRQVPAPGGGATDDDESSSYAEEARRLGLDRLPYNIPLGDEEVIAAVSPIHDAGKNSKIRTYSCIFWARVWDRTSPGAKARWKDAHHRILEGLLGTYLVSNDPWQD